MIALWAAAVLSTGTLSINETYLDHLYDGSVVSGAPAEPLASEGRGLSALPLPAPPPTPTPSVRAQTAPLADSDGDGLSDELEFELARTFVPILVWAKGEKCGEHDTLYQVHPLAPGRVRLTYALIFPIDCGFRSSGIGGHSGDVQEMGIDVVLLESGWTIETVTLPWHSPFHPKGRPVLFVSEGKHHIYPNLESCLHGRFLGFDHCGDGAVETPALNEDANVGEAAHPLMTTLEKYAAGPWAAGYAKETAWGQSLFGDDAFCGGDPNRGGRGSFVAKVKSLIGWDPCGDALDGKWSR